MKMEKNMTQTEMTIKQATAELAQLMAREAVNKKDVQTTGEARSMLIHAYKVAHTMLEEPEERYAKSMA